MISTLIISLVLFIMMKALIIVTLKSTCDQSVHVVEDDDDKEVADKMKPVSPVVDKEITNILIQLEAVCIVIDDD